MLLRYIASILVLVFIASCVSIKQILADIDNKVIQQGFDNIQSSNPKYMEFQHISVDTNEVFTLLVDNNIDGLEQYSKSQDEVVDNFDDFISTYSFVASEMKKMDSIDNKVGWVTVNENALNGTGFLVAPELALIYFA